LAALGLALAGLAVGKGGQPRDLTSNIAPVGIPSHAIPYRRDINKLHLHARNSVTSQKLTYEVLYIDTSGQYQHVPLPTYTPDTDRSAPSPETFEEIGDGWIIGAIIKASQTTKRCETYAQLALCKGSAATAFQLIISKYITNFKPGQFPSPDAIEDPLSGDGLKVDNEAATTLGNNDNVTRTITVPTNVKATYYGGAIYQVDDVARNVTFRTDDGTQRLWNLKDNATTYAQNERPTIPTGEADKLNLPAGAFPLPLSAGDRIHYTFNAGGASSGGTARSSAIWKEWIDP